MDDKKLKKIIGKKIDKKIKKRLKQLDFFKENTESMRLAAEEWDEEWKTLIAIIMSAQSRDEVTIKIAQELFEKFPTLKKLSKAQYQEIFKTLKSLNYNKTKTKRIIGCAKKLLEKYDGKVPHDFDLLISLPGVGRKTANVFLSEFGEPTIGVDTHITYISTKMGWTNGKTQKKIEEDLKKKFPKKYWGSLNPIIVSFGRSHKSKKKKDALLAEAKKLK
jgi:endonuclease III